MSAEENHLSVEQIQALIEARRASDAQARSIVFEETKGHLAACEGCRRLVSVYEERDRMLRGLKADMPAAAAKDCPTDESPHELAGGVLKRDEADEVLKHAMQCDHCGPVLRQATELFVDEVSPEEESFIGSLESNKSSRRAELGAMVLRVPATGAFGHVAISDGLGGTVEAHSPADGVVEGKLANRRWTTGILLPNIQHTPGASLAPVVPAGTIFRLTLPLMTGSAVRKIQERLLAKGFDPGAPDGELGRIRRPRSSLCSWQMG